MAQHDPHQDAAKRRVYGDVPPVILCGAPPKVGKTTDSIYFLPNALCLFSDGGLKPAIGVVGWAPLDTDEKAKTIGQATMAIAARIKAGDPKKGLQFKNEAGQSMYGIILDDLTPKIKATIAEIEANPPKSSDGKVNKFAIWQSANNQAGALIKMCREIGQPVYLSAHLREPGVDEETKEKIPGGPDVGSRSLSNYYSAIVDVITYVIDDATRPRWAHGLSCNTRGGTWLAGDRHNVITTGASGQPYSTPLNTAEVVRAAGYTVPRALPMEGWTEHGVAYIVDQVLVQKKPEHTIIQDVVKAMRAQAREPWQIAWVLRDAFDRIEIQQKSQKFNPLLAWGITL